VTSSLSIYYVIPGISYLMELFSDILLLISKLFGSKNCKLIIFGKTLFLLCLIFCMHKSQAPFLLFWGSVAFFLVFGFVSAFNLVMAFLNYFIKVTILLIRIAMCNCS
jgi:hypothetical protein